LHEVLETYGVKLDITLNNKLPVSESIYELLFSGNERIQKNNTKQIPQKTLDFYLNVFSEQIDKGLPIEFFLTSFSPKFKFSHLSGFYIYPDINDLFSLIHLNKLAKKIREHISHNFRFLVVFSGDLYKNIGMWSDLEIKKTFDIIQEMNCLAEEFVGVKNSVEIIQWKHFFDDLNLSFKDSMYQKAQAIYEDFLEGDDSYANAIKERVDSINYFFGAEHEDIFYNEFFYKETAKLFAVENLLFEQRSFLRIINRELKSNLLIAQTTENSKLLSFEMNPFSKFNAKSDFTKSKHKDPFFNDYHYFSIIVFDGEKWSQTFWDEVAHLNPVPIYLSDNKYKKIDSPLYFYIQKKESH